MYLVSFRHSHEMRPDRWSRRVSGGRGVRSLGADHISLEAMAKTLACPLSETGAQGVLNRGVMRPIVGFKEIPLGEWRR